MYVLSPTVCSALPKPVIDLSMMFNLLQYKIFVWSLSILKQDGGMIKRSVLKNLQIKKSAFKLKALYKN
jgi:hypothetical protein